MVTFRAEEIRAACDFVTLVTRHCELNPAIELDLFVMSCYHRSLSVLLAAERFAVSTVDHAKTCNCMGLEASLLAVEVLAAVRRVQDTLGLPVPAEVNR